MPAEVLGIVLAGTVRTPDDDRRPGLGTAHAGVQWATTKGRAQGDDGTFGVVGQPLHCSTCSRSVVVAYGGGAAFGRASALLGLLLGGRSPS